MKRYISEFLGTALLVIVGCGAASSTVSDVFSVALSFGLIITVLCYVLGPISGGHFNPAVTMGMFVSGYISKRETFIYIIFQFLGAIVGAFLLSLMFNVNTGLGVNYLQRGITVSNAIAYEFVFSAFFVFVVLQCNVSKYPRYNGLIIGITLMVSHLIGIAVTGTSLNPARSLGPALITMHFQATEVLWIFLLVPFVAAIFAAILFRYFNIKKV